VADSLPKGRWGIGPCFGTITIVCALAAAHLTRRHPDLFGLPVVPDALSATLGVLLVICGTWIYVYTLLVLNRAVKAGTLAVTGPFAQVRHPLYASWIVLLIPGVAFLMHSWLVLSAAVVGYGSFRALITREETTLAARYGEAYRKYESTHNRLIPRLGKKKEDMR